jgi:hypothetical protein
VGTSNLELKEIDSNQMTIPLNDDAKGLVRRNLAQHQLLISQESDENTLAHDRDEIENNSDESLLAPKKVSYLMQKLCF